MTIATYIKNSHLDLCMTYAPVSNVRFVFGIAMSFCMALTAFAVGDERVDYASQIKPLLQARCFACHGALRQEAGLRLDTAAAIHAGGDSGAAVTAGDVSSSLLIERVSELDIDQRMPPEFEGEQLSPTEIQLLSAWIIQGATAPETEKAEADPKDHWAFQPIRRPRVPSQFSPDNAAPTPADPNSAWVKNPIDAFIAEQHRQNGLTAQEPAPRSILLRRLYLDLIGIPPSPEVIAAVESATDDDWYAQAVEELLNDPRHGERWARHWMDIWRYSDWWGLGEQLRNSQKHIWHWRDWIVESLNDDVAYDEMLRSMLAADELYPEDQSQLRATGYLARNYFLFNRPQWMEETVEHVSKGFLGLTLNCAKCHDHKYDPVTHADFYRMRAFFEPYHVRMDILPGESDLQRNGLPRVFESQLITPTYLYIRGQETNPDKSREILPGIPDFLAFDSLAIQPVELPASAWQPERQPWVIDNHMATATAKLESAQRALDVARGELVKAEQQAAQVASKTIVLEDVAAPELNANSIHDRFDAWDTVLWQQLGGRWQHQPGQLHQLSEGGTQAALRWTQVPPEDFDATLRFTITGGSQWRSVCIAFDVTQDDPTSLPTSQDSEQMVYVSAHTGGPKIQAAYSQGGTWQFPSDARQSQPIVLNREYLLQVQVRGQLINASLDGQPAFAWQSPLARHSGFMQLSTFDAAVVFHEVTIKPLAPETRLLPAVNSGDPTNPQTLVTLAQSDVEVAEATLSVAQADQARVAAVAAAMRCEWAAAASHDEDQTASLKEVAQARRVEAVQAERRSAAANAQLAVTTAAHAVLRAVDDKKAAADQALATACTALDKAIELAQSDVAPTDDFTKFTGAQWTPTRFLDSSKDDPNIEFAQRSSGRRSALASWITDARNPLTARVAANHIWSRHMGQPLVATVFDFGRNGARPTHPELLDWLACELIEHDWSMKHLHRLIVNSATYRLSSANSGQNSAGAAVTTNQQLDPDNHFWWRRSAIRMESQVVRDSILSLAGNLDPSMGGPTIAPAEQAASLRRSLYFFHSNNDRNLFLSTFDEAMVKDCYRREQSIVPQQALALTNSRLVLEQSELIAQRLSQSHQAEQSFIYAAFCELLGFEPGDAELAAASLALEGWRGLPDGSESAARAQLIWALINHNDFVTLR